MLFPTRFILDTVPLSPGFGVAEWAVSNQHPYYLTTHKMYLFLFCNSQTFQYVFRQKYLFTDFSDYNSLLICFSSSFLSSTQFISIMSLIIASVQTFQFFSPLMNTFNFQPRQEVAFSAFFRYWILSHIFPFPTS